MIRSEVMAYLKVTQDKYKRLAKENIRNYKATRDMSCLIAAEIYKDVTADIREIKNSIKIL